MAGHDLLLVLPRKCPTAKHACKANIVHDTPLASGNIIWPRGASAVCSAEIFVDVCYNLAMTRHKRPRVYAFKLDASRGIAARFGPMWGPNWQGYLVFMLTVDQEFQLRVHKA